MRSLAAAVVIAAVGLAVVGCAGSGARRQAAPTTVSEQPVSPPADELRAARASDRSLFTIFPATIGKRSCSIPAGGPVKRLLRGTCETSVAKTYGATIAVSFTERWGVLCSGRNGSGRCRTPQRHRWQVIERPGARVQVLTTRSMGDPAPQFQG